MLGPHGKDPSRWASEVGRYPLKNHADEGLEAYQLHKIKVQGEGLGKVAAVFQALGRVEETVEDP